MILEIHFFITCFILFVTGLLTLTCEAPDEIENFYDWLFYGLLWELIVIKYLFKFLIKLWR